jgi:hypothetical protein
VKRLLIAVAAACALVVATTAGAAGTTIVAKPVNVTNSLYAGNEESLGMDASGTLLAGSWNDWHYNDGCGFSYSTDGGTSWAPESFVPGLTAYTNDPSIPGTGTYGIAGDPAVAYNPRSGLFDVICQAFGAKGGAIQLLSTTFNAARANPNADVNQSYGLNAWRLPATPIATGTSNGTQKGSNGKFPDHETIAVDTRPSSPHYGRLYVGWAEFSGFGRSPIDVAYSDDDGAHWNGPIRVSDSGHQFDQDARPAVAADGTLYMTWINGPNENSLKNNVAMIDVSHDGGATWGTDHVVAPILDPIPGSLPNSNYRVFTDVWSTVDQATGSVVVAFTDQRSGAANVYVTHNVQGNLDAWSSAKAVKPSGQEQFFPWLSSAPNGRVDLVYYDRSCDPAHDTLNCVTLSSTRDSGASWSSVSLQPQGFDGDKYQACLAFVDPPNCGVYFLGDYIAVASTNSKAQALWTGNGRRAMDVFSGRATFIGG